MTAVFRAGLLFWFCLVVVTACASRSPSLSSPNDGRSATEQLSVAGAPGIGAATEVGAAGATPPPSTATASTSPPHDCSKAAQQRARIPQLLAEGKLHRTLRVIDLANQLCSETSKQTRLVELQTLAEIGRYKAARELAEKIRANAPSDEVRTAVNRALKLVAERDVTMPDTDEAKAPMRRAWRQADVAATNKQYGKARELFVRAWTLWHPKNGRALAAAGHFAKLAGDAPGAQRLFDRALEELEQQYGTTTRIEFPPQYRGANSIAWQPKQQVLAVADGPEIVLVDAITSHEIRRLKGHASTVMSVAFSLDGGFLASTDNATLRLWRIADGAEIRSFEGHTYSITSVAFSPDGKTLASGSWDQTLRLWRVADGAEIRTLKGHTDSVTSVAFSPDGKSLASGSRDNTIRLWRVADGTEIRTLKGHTYSITSVAFSPDDKTLASGSDDNTIRLWGVADGAEIRTLKGHTAGVTSVAFSPDGQALASGSDDNTIRLWGVADGAEIRTLKGHAAGVTSVAFSPDSTGLASGSRDTTLRLWIVANGAQTWKVEGLINSDESLVFSPDDKSLASGGRNDEEDALRLWHLPDGILIRSFQGQIFREFSPDGKTVATYSKDGSLSLWRLSDGTLIRSFQGQIFREFSPDGKTVATYSKDGTLSLWRLSGGTVIRSLQGQIFREFSPDGKTFATASKDNTLSLWRVSDGTLIRSLADHPLLGTIVAFSPDGKTLATVCQTNAVRLWRVADGSLIRSLEGHTKWVISIAFSPDSRTLISTCEDNTVRFWRVADGALVRSIAGQKRQLASAVFSTDGKVAAPGSTRTPQRQRVANEATSHAASHDGIYVATAATGDGVRVSRADDSSFIVRLVAPDNHDVGINLSADSQHFDISGTDAQWALENALLCRIGPIALPLEICTERTRVPGWVAKILAKDPSAFEP